MKNHCQIQAVLFDMDGVVIDTEKLYCRFWQEAAQALGYPMTREQALGMRSLNREIGEKQLKSYFGQSISYTKVRNKRMELMDAHIEREGVESKPGIGELLDFLEQEGIAKAITTSSPLERTKKYLSTVHLVERFDRLISGYMVEKGKPEPDIYLYAAKEMGVQPWECLVLEDSPAGILAAHRAGCIPLMIPDLDEPASEILPLLAGQEKSLQDVITFIKRW